MKSANHKTHKTFWFLLYEILRAVNPTEAEARRTAVARDWKGHGKSFNVCGVAVL